MRALSSTKIADNSTVHLFARSRGTKENAVVIYPAASSAFPIMRKASCACGGGCPACRSKLPIRAKLSISEPGDIYEQEADRVADLVMRIPVGEAKPGASNMTSENSIHRKCSSCEDEEETIQRKALPSGGGVPSESPAHVSNALSSGGQPLDRQTRSFFEPRLGYDLASVRIHTDSIASQSARAIDAKAYALGSNIVFAETEYRPDSESGRHLLAHELAHVVQQSNVTGLIRRQAKGSAGGCGICMNDPGGMEAGIIAHAEIQMAFGASNPNIIGEYAVPVVEEGRPRPFVPEIDLSYQTSEQGQKIMHIGEIKPLDDAGKQAGIARAKLKDYARELMANPELGIDEVFRMRDAPPPGPIPFFNPSHPPGCPPQMIYVKLTEPGIYQYYCEPPWSALVKDPRCKCRKRDEEEKKEEKVKELEKPQTEEEKQEDKDKDRGVPPYVLPAVATGLGVSAAAYLRKRAIALAEKRAQQLAWRKIAEAAAARRAAAAAGKGAAGKVVGKAAAYVEIAAAAALIIFYSDRVEAQPGPGESPIESLYKAMTINGTPPSPEMKKLIESDPLLKKLAEDAAKSGDGSKLQEEMTRRTLQMIKDNPDVFTAEDLEFLAEYSKKAGAAGQAPETVEQLRKAIDVAKTGKIGSGGNAGKTGDNSGKGSAAKGGEGAKSPADAGTGSATPVPTTPSADVPSGPKADKIQGLSEESAQKIKSAPQPVSKVFEAFVSTQKTEVKLDDAFVKKFFEIVLADLTDSQAEAIISRVVATPGQTPDAILQSLKEAVEQVRKDPAQAVSGSAGNEQPTGEGKPEKTQQQIIDELQEIASKYDFSKIPKNSYHISSINRKIEGTTISTNIYAVTKEGIGVVGYMTGNVPPGTDITKLKKGDSIVIETTSISPLVDKVGNVHNELYLGKKIVIGK